MYLSSLFNYYRIGRFIFAIALLIAFQIAGLPYAIPGLMFILAIYSFIALLRLIIFTKKIHYFDFLLDIVFISAMVYISLGVYSYLTLLYLFPIFFSSVIIKTKKIFLLPIISAVLYGASYYISGVVTEKESILNISLHFLSFSLIALAGDNLKERMEKQEQHIKNLEEEKIKMKGYERLYRVSADLAHELRNPLASISAAVQFLNEGRNDREFIDMLNAETKRLTTLVNDFLLFSRPSDAQKEDVDLSETLKTLVNRQNSDKKITLDIKSNAMVIANRTFLEVAINNIIKNAIEAARSEIRVSLKKVRSSELGVQSSEKILIEIEIEDDGAGIEEDMKDRIFEPFVTTKAGGTGLGLAIAYRIITGFCGNLTVDRSSLGGAKFTILFPSKGMTIIRKHG
jgi:signal transduction histidine kinase